MVEYTTPDGHVLPAVITRAWSPTSVNLVVLNGGTLSGHSPFMYVNSVQKADGDIPQRGRWNFPDQTTDVLDGEINFVSEVIERDGVAITITEEGGAPAASDPPLSGGEKPSEEPEPGSTSSDSTDQTDQTDQTPEGDPSALLTETITDDGPQEPVVATTEEAPSAAAAAAAKTPKKPKK
jgi:hypothetical protein